MNLTSTHAPNWQPYASHTPSALSTLRESTRCRIHLHLVDRHWQATGARGAVSAGRADPTVSVTLVRGTTDGQPEPEPKPVRVDGNAPRPRTLVVPTSVSTKGPSRTHHYALDAYDILVMIFDTFDARQPEDRQTCLQAARVCRASSRLVHSHEHQAHTARISVSFLFFQFSPLVGTRDSFYDGDYIGAVAQL